MTRHDADADAAPVHARRASRIDQVIEVLREELGSGRWPVGSRIPTEPELAELTGTGRNTVREAVQALVHAGLLERRQGSGTYVVADSELAVAVGRRVAEARNRDVLEVRRTLEVGAARLAATRRTAADVAELRELLARRTAARTAGDLDDVAAADLALHRAIARASRNPVLSELYDHLIDAIAENVRVNIGVRLRTADNDHADLVAAIVDGDPQRAALEAARFIDELLGEGC
ncbi:FadR/GntR family transcriptional regulator [Quadrisphaera sp. GCM10027208]|uniref:FadR/GntR family transcriptional regulator n=1 Tax=Quadrisphaera sp. GCM10027208 TaxID=3273423 RepID=UPI00361B390C